MVLEKTIKDVYTCSINDYIKCWFDGNYAVLGEGATREHFENIRLKYIDTSGGFQTVEFDMKKRYFKLENRINAVNIFLFGQRKYIEEIGVPNLKHLNMLKDYGHRPKWNNDSATFLRTLEKIEIAEKRTQSDFDILEKQLLSLQGNTGVPIKDRDERASFTRMLIGLEIKTQSDRSGIAMYDLALMVKSNREQAEQIEMERAQKQHHKN